MERVIATLFPNVEISKAIMFLMLTIVVLPLLTFTIYWLYLYFSRKPYIKNITKYTDILDVLKDMEYNQQFEKKKTNFAIIISSVASVFLFIVSYFLLISDVTTFLFLLFIIPSGLSLYFAPKTIKIEIFNIPKQYRELHYERSENK